MNKKIENWKKANAIYSELVHLSIKDALEKLQLKENLEPEIIELVSNLIHSGNESNEFIEEKLISFPQIGSQLVNQLEGGEEIDDYQLVEEIGKGGMSKVYKAERVNTENQKAVAIKVFLSDESNKKLLKLFKDEQKILSTLSHPNIISMHHGGRTGKGISYLVMELLQGALDIDDYVKKHRLSLRKKIILILKAAKAIEYAHSKLIIHRDIKPSNILVDERGELKVVDFGIAKMLVKEGESKNTTIMALTPTFASPEQLKSKSVSVSTDVFSLALLAVSIINGKDPFEKNRILKSSDDEKNIEKTLKHTKIDTDLKNIFNKALKIDPSSRYENMYKFSDDLSAWLDNKPVSATKDSFFYIVKKFAKRRTALFTTLTTLFITFTIGVVLLSWQYKKIKIEAQKAQEVKNFMLDAFESTDPDIAAGTEITANNILDSADLKLNNDLEIDDEIRFELLQSIGVAFGKIGEYDKSIKNLENSLKIKPYQSKSISYLVQFLLLSDNTIELNRLLNSINIDEYDSYEDVSRIIRVKANNLVNNGEFEQAKQLVDLIINQNTLNKNNLDYIQNQSLLAGIISSESNSDEAIRILKSIIKEGRLPKNHTLMLGIQKQLIDVYNNSGDFEKAYEEINLLINLQQGVFKKEHPTIAMSYYQLASILRNIGQIEKAQNAINESLIMSRSLYGEKSIQVAHSLNLKGVLLADLGEINESIQLNKKVIEIFTEVKGADHKDTLVLGSNLAAMLNRNNRSEEALEHLGVIYKINLEKLGEKHHETLYTRKIIAYTFSKLKRHKDAIFEIEGAVQIAKSNFKSTHPIVSSLVYNQAMIYKANNQPEEALKTYKEIIDDKMVLESNILYAITLKRLAMLNEELENNEEAYIQYKKSISLYKKAYGKESFNTLDLQVFFIKFLIIQGHYKEAEELITTIEPNIDDSNKKHSILKQRINEAKSRLKKD